MGRKNRTNRERRAAGILFESFRVDPLEAPPWRFFNRETWLKHPILPLVISVLLGGVSGASMELKVLGVFLCGIWIAADLWPWWNSASIRLTNFVFSATVPFVNQQATKDLICGEMKAARSATHLCIRSIGFVFICLLISYGAIWGSRIFIQQYLSEEREDVRNKLSIESSIPHGLENDPMKSIISVTNDSKYGISAKHRIACKLNLATDDTGASMSFHDVFAFQDPDGNYQLSGGPLSQIPIEESTPIQAGGDAQSSSCIGGFHFPGKIECADLTIIFQYFLEDQPNFPQEKKQRVTTYGKNGFQWYKDSIDRRSSYCAHFLKRQP